MSETVIRVYTLIGDGPEIQCRTCGLVNLGPDYDDQNTWMESHECLPTDVEAWMLTRETLGYAENRRADYSDEAAKLTAFTTDITELTGAYDMSIPDMVIALSNTLAGVGRFLAAVEGDPDYPALGRSPSNVVPHVEDGGDPELS